MNVVDSSGWIEYLINGPGAASFATAIESLDELLVPSIVLTEVGRWLRAREPDAQLRAQAMDVMMRATIIELDTAIALAAIRPAQRRLPLADAVVYATALAHGATVWTQDVDFDGLPGVRFFPKPTP